MVDLTTTFWLIFIATLLLIVSGCPRRAAPVFVVALLAAGIVLT